MRKFALAILGLASVGGLLILISSIISITSSLIRRGIVVDTDHYINIWIVLPVVLLCYLTYKLWSDPRFYNRYKTTVNMATWTIIITVVLALLMTLVLIVTKSDPMGLLMVGTVLLMGAVLSFILAIIGFMIDRKRVSSR